VFDEAYDKWTHQFNGGHRPFAETWEDDLRDFIERDRNHPSVFVWSVGNEVFSYQMQETNNWGVDQLRAMVVLRAGREAGDAALRATAENLPAAEVRLQVGAEG
jgi:beta-galactosidase/beta-glucuronidase